MKQTELLQSRALNVEGVIMFNICLSWKWILSLQHSTKCSSTLMYFGIPSSENRTKTIFLIVFVNECDTLKVPMFC